MELILISNSKLKIMLNESDMKQYKIGDEADCAQISTRRAIRTLLDKVRDQIGFDTEGEEIFVQLYTSKHGGCELFVTKCNLSESCNANPAEAADTGTSKNQTLPDKKTKKRQSTALALPSALPESKSCTKKEFEYMAFSFSSLALLCKVCKVLSKQKKSYTSSAFADSNGKYYLLLQNTGCSAYTRLDKLSFISEYGDRENPDALLAYIHEHGKSLCCEEAIEVLGALY